MNRQQYKGGVLTERELQVLCHIAKGQLNKEIAVDLQISLDTVKKHVKNIYKKIKARNRIDAVNYALHLKPKNEHRKVI